MYLPYLPLITAIVILIYNLTRRDFIFSYPTILSGTVLYFVAPGLIYYGTGENKIEHGPGATAIYVTLCLIGGTLGWARPMRGLRTWFPADRKLPSFKFLLTFSAAVIVFAAFFGQLIKDLDPELLESTQWSGPQTIYYFFSRTGLFIVPVTWIVWLRTRRIHFLILGCISLSLFLLPAVFAGKRDEIVELSMIFAVCWVLVLKFRLPHLLVVSVAIAAALIFSQIGSYRSVYKEEGILAGLVAAWEAGGTGSGPERMGTVKYPEVENLVTTLEIANESRWPNFGTAYWNGIVHRFIPGQWIGHSLKEGLKFPDASISRTELQQKGATAVTGTTSTGFSDTFQAFLWLGFFIYYLIGRALSALFIQARNGSNLALFIYPNLIVSSGVAVTHTTNSLIASIINITVFMVIWIKWGERLRVAKSNEG